MLRLDVGCGQNKTPGDIGMDIIPGPQVDVVHSFDVFPYPFEDNTFDEVKCDSSLEHVADVIATVAEIHRILKPGGKLLVWVPHYSGPYAYRDLTHKSFFSYFSLECFTRGMSYENEYSGMYAIKHRQFGLPGRKVGLFKAIPKAIANRWPDFYETYLCWIMPAKTIYCEMEAIK